MLVEAFAQQAPCGWRDVLPAAQINERSHAEVMLVRRTVENMVQAGDLVRVGSQKPAGSRVYSALYEPAKADGQGFDMSPIDSSLNALATATRTWATFD